MNIHQYLSRVQAPTLPTPILHREALVHLLARYLEQPALTSSTPPKLILLCAPAGYGKTTLLVDTMRQISATCCWYFFESTDTPDLFLKSLLRSIQQGFPEIGNHLTAFSDLDQRANEEVAWETILDQLVETFNSQISQHFVLALCNYHTIQQNKVLNRLIDRLLAHPPLRAVLVIESRSLPNLNLAPLIAQRQMFGIGSNKLRFTAQELYELAHLQGFTTFSWSDAEHLASSFEGWIAGILLGSSLGYTQMHPLAPSHKGNWGELAQLTDRQSLAAYIDEIFRQETITYEFLTAVSILDQLTPAHCNTLLGSTDAAQRLIYAEQQGLFVVRSEQSAKKDDVGVYICHPVLRELFKEKLRVQSFSLYLDLHRKAAYLLYNDQMYEQALTHALQAQEYSLATTILTQIAPDLVIQGESKIVGHWLDMLPEQILKQDPWILMILINIHLTRNEYAQVPPLLEAVESLLETCSLAQDQKGSLLLYAEMCLARSKLLFYQRDFQQ
ncbi:MAG TPA: hypothetical protein VFN35_14480, partial [Ktedonobacteraceae bacterium]|nr:hypothetical protein [Ktedonobacteraceae bacterium]